MDDPIQQLKPVPKKERVSPKSTRRLKASKKARLVSSSLRIIAAKPDAALLDLPWDKPLSRWPDSIVAALPQGISRHVVRFVHPDGRILAIKEISNSAARHKYQILCVPQRLDAPCVESVAAIIGGTTRSGHPLNSVFVSEHLPYSLPYRALFGQYQRLETVDRLIRALSVLLMRLHLLGFFWGDISPSNALFRRDAGEFAAYLVDAGTGEVYDGITQGKRLYDTGVTHMNIIGELMGLQAAGHLSEDYNTIDIGNRLVAQYTTLWDVLTGETASLMDEKWRVNEHVKRSNELSFDADGFQTVADEDGRRIRIQPKVVDAGHFSRKIIRLADMDAQESQVGRLAQDIEQYRVAANKSVSLSIAAHDWMTNAFEPMIDAMPREFKGKLESAELFHQFLDHHWYISEQAGRDIPIDEAIANFIDNVLRHQRDERPYIVISGATPITSASPTTSDSPITGDNPITGDSVPSVESGDEDEFDDEFDEDKYDS